MRPIIIAILISVASCKSKVSKGNEATASVSETPQIQASKVATIRLIEEQALPVPCGIAAAAVALKFDIVKVSKSIAETQIIAIIPCPELYGEGFFKKGRLYEAVLTTQSRDTATYNVASNYQDSQLPTYWVERLEKLY